MSFWKSDEKLPVFAFLIPGLRSNIKHSTQYFITKWNTSKLVKNTQLRVVFSALFSVFYLVMKHCVSFLIYYFQVLLKLGFLRSYSSLAIWQHWMEKWSGEEEKVTCVHKQNLPKAHLFTTCCSNKNCKSGLLCTVSNFTYCPRHRKAILNRNKRHRQEENAPKLYSKTDRLAYFTRSISSCLYVIYAHKS